MTGKKGKFESWEEVIINFLQQKIDAEEAKYLKSQIDLIDKLYKADVPVQGVRQPAITG